MPNDHRVYYTTMPSPLGELLLTGDGRRLTGLYMSPQPRGRARAAGWVRRNDLFAGTRRQLEEYFSGTRRTFSIRLAPAGTDFQQRVWRALRAIPYAATVSYGDIGRAIGNPRGMRAVGLANGRNPIPIIIPCHRVIGSNGALTGYGGGLGRKRWLLGHERRHGRRPYIRRRRPSGS